eukprot:9464799-Alexandrium_andersonii.AAC.1
MYLDSSTSTSGSTWYDSGGNNNNGTVVGAIFLNSNGGVFGLDGSNDYVGTSANLTVTEATLV